MLKIQKTVYPSGARLNLFEWRQHLGQELTLMYFKNHLNVINKRSNKKA